LLVVVAVDKQFTQVLLELKVVVEVVQEVIVHQVLDLAHYEEQH
jgi:hypothetical protein